jgi:hypothetical protein
MATTLAEYEELNRRLPRNEPNRFPLHVLAVGMRRGSASLDWANALLADTLDRGDLSPRRFPRARR